MYRSARVLLNARVLPRCKGFDAFDIDEVQERIDDLKKLQKKFRIENGQNAIPARLMMYAKEQGMMQSG